MKCHSYAVVLYEMYKFLLIYFYIIGYLFYIECKSYRLKALQIILRVYSILQLSHTNKCLPYYLFFFFFFFFN